MKIDLTRREFLAAGAVATILPHLPPLFAQSTIAAPDETWARKTKRWAQLTLAENDAADFDLDFWLAYFRQTKSDGICFSAGGCVAYYPTEVPFHHRSAWLGKRDIVGEVIEGCRKLGMSILLRTDPHATYTTTQRLRILTGSPVLWMASRAATGHLLRCGLRARLARTILSS